MLHNKEGKSGKLRCFVSPPSNARLEPDQQLYSEHSKVLQCKFILKGLFLLISGNCTISKGSVVLRHVTALCPNLYARICCP